MDEKNEKHWEKYRKPKDTKLKNAVIYMDYVI